MKNSLTVILYDNTSKGITINFTKVKIGSKGNKTKSQDAKLTLSLASYSIPWMG